MKKEKQKVKFAKTFPAENFTYLFNLWVEKDKKQKDIIQIVDFSNKKIVLYR